MSTATHEAKDPNVLADISAAADEAYENILAAINATADDGLEAAYSDPRTELIIKELVASAHLAKSGLRIKVVQASQMSLEDLREFAGLDDEEDVIEGLIDLQATSLPKKLTGDLAQTSVGSGTAIAITGTTASASAVITSPSSTTGITIGMPITGTGVPVGTTIIGLSPLTMSTNATASGSSVALSVGGETQVIGLAEWTLDWKRKTADATTTDDSAYESSLGSTASWSAKAKYMFLVGDTTQSNAIIAAISAPQAPQVWNFFPDVTIGHPAYNGFAYIDGITIAAGTGKIVGLDVSLKGTGPLTVATQLAPVAQALTNTGEQSED